MEPSAFSPGATWSPRIAPSVTQGKDAEADSELLARYRDIVAGTDNDWATRCRDLRIVGRGGQGVVFFANCEGADGFLLSVALKVFPQTHIERPPHTRKTWGVSPRSLLASHGVQHENLVAVHDFTAHRACESCGWSGSMGTTSQVLTRETLELDPESIRKCTRQVRRGCHPDRWALSAKDEAGSCNSRAQGMSSGMAALHREGISHGDLKPSNVMLKRTGSARVVDIGSAVDLRLAGGRQVWSPLYAAPEVLTDGLVTPQADLASLGYVLVEMLSGRSPFEGAVGVSALLEAKRTLEHRLPDLLPERGRGKRTTRCLVSTDGGIRPRQEIPGRRGRRFGPSGSCGLPPSIG